MKLNKSIISLGIVALSSTPLRAAIVSGYIQVKDSNQLAIGYIASSYETLGEYGLTSNTADRLLVSFDDASPTFSLSLVNSQDSTFGFLGAIVGYSTASDYMGAGNPNYLYLGGTSQTAVGATPTVGANSFSVASSVYRNYESAIWSISGNVFSSQWTNPDSSPSSLSAVVRNNLLLLTGDASAFTETFGSGQVVSLNFVPIPEPSAYFITAAGAILACTIRRNKKSNL